MMNEPFECTAFKGLTPPWWQRWARRWGWDLRFHFSLRRIKPIVITPAMAEALKKGMTGLFNPDPQIHAAAERYWRGEGPDLKVRKDAFALIGAELPDVCTISGTGRFIGDNAKCSQASIEAIMLETVEVSQNSASGCHESDDRQAGRPVAPPQKADK